MFTSTKDGCEGKWPSGDSNMIHNQPGAKSAVAIVEKCKTPLDEGLRVKA